MVRFAVFGVAVALWAAPSGTAAARPASTGWFAEGGLGAVKFLPKASADAALGPSLNLHVGRDLFERRGDGTAAADRRMVPALPRVR